MNDKLTMSDEWSLCDGTTFGTGTLCRFKASGLPGGDEAVFVNVSSMPHVPLWRIEGRENWQRFKQHCHKSETVLHFTDGTKLAIDLREYSPTLSGLRARYEHPNVEDAIRGWG
jgi:hypothetical protein